ncbi:MAG: helix-turn-helix transcriptional regulator [Lentimicrobium sp.]|nr:helix-turn-helix transcriptional regulator [Lentimicrobium sp.]
MIQNNANEYTLFFRFIETYAPQGFKEIKAQDPLIQELELMLEKNQQFFFVCDLIQVKILYTSKQSTRMIGIEPANVTPYHFFEATHPNDIQRHSLGRTKLFKLANDFFISEKGSALLSTNLQLRNSLGKYDSFLFQCYLFYSEIPVKTVYLIQVHTDISWFNNFKHVYHYYIGNNMSFFRYPDEKLLKLGNIFSEREFSIIKMIAAGLSSEQIAQQIFLSIHTVNTHRRNILKKTGKLTFSELIYDLVEKGLL